MLHNCTITFSVLPYYIIIQKCTQNIAMYAFTGVGCTMIRSILDQSHSRPYFLHTLIALLRLMVRWVIGLIPHDGLIELYSFQPVHSAWINKSYPLYGIMHIRSLVAKCSGSRGFFSFATQIVLYHMPNVI